MSEAGIAITIMSLLIFFIFLGFFVWGLKTGQFRDIEEAKYRIFEIQEEEFKDPSEQEMEK